MLAKALQGAALATQPVFIEDTFSSFLYTGNGSTQTITNGVDLSGKGGLVWIKDRSGAYTTGHFLFDTTRGANKYLRSEQTSAEGTLTNSLNSFNSNGFSLGSNVNVNSSDALNYVSWTLRKQAKFFDVVTYTGNGANRTIAHNLGSTPGCIIVKSTTAVSNWSVYHRSTSATDVLLLNSTDPTGAVPSFWNNTSPTSTDFTVGTNSNVNLNGGTYVAYLFAHDAGGFGAAGTDNVISCGSYTGNGSTTGPIINLGWEPQWILLKPSTVVDNWNIIDNMRGATVSGSNPLYANATTAEGGVAANVAINATGFQPNSTNSGVNGSGQTYIYIAIRRGPMKTPTSGTEVFGLNARTGTGANATVTGGTGSDDLAIIKNRGSGSEGALWASRLAANAYMKSNSTAAETTSSFVLPTNPWDVMDGIKVGTTSAATNASANTFINYLFRRAPGFFDEVCYTGTGANRTVSHNLGAVPEMMIVKNRSIIEFWVTYVAPLGNTKFLALQSTNAAAVESTYWNNTSPTVSSFTVGTDNGVNGTTYNYVAYLFATVSGVSKVGSYTGNGSNQTINCGFTAGARFIMIKRTDSTGDWYVWDTARGIVAGNDPHLSLNTTAAEVTTDDTIDPDNSGFIVNQVAATNVNVSSATYIFLAVS